MKRKGIVIALLLFTIVISGYSQEKLFEKFSDQDNITTISISKALLSMVPSSAFSGSMNGVDINSILSKLEQIDIFTSQDNDAKNMIRTEVESNFKKNKAYESLMTVKDKESNIAFYAQKKNNKFQSLVMFVDGLNESVLIRLLGEFTAEDIQKLVDSTSKND